MAGKDTLQPCPILTNVDMATTVTSVPYQMAWFDNICVTLWFSGSPMGTFSVLVGSDNVNLVPMDLNPAPVALGAAGVIVIDIMQLSPRYIQVIYSPSSGDGTLNVTVSGKMV